MVTEAEVRKIAALSLPETTEKPTVLVNPAAVGVKELRELITDS